MADEDCGAADAVPELERGEVWHVEQRAGHSGVGDASDIFFGFFVFLHCIALANLGV